MNNDTNNGNPSDRLMISQLLLSDWPAVYELLSNAQVMRFIGPRRPMTQQEAQQWFDQQLASPSRYVFRWEVSGDLVGFCGVQRQDQQLDFGYFIRQCFWGHGLGLQLCQMALQRLQQHYDLSSLQVFIADENVASQKLAQRLGWLIGKRSSNAYEQGNMYHIEPIEPIEPKKA